MKSTDISNLFSPVLSYPDTEANERLGRLVGLDDHKSRLTKLLGCMVHPDGFKMWAKIHHPDAPSLVDLMTRRPPLIVLAGDVGSGKTELAESIGDAVARQEEIDIVLFPLSLASRGHGLVGEMSQLLAKAFDHVISECEKLVSESGKPRGAAILLIDEADALAQSREESQMHHEDRAGVNTLIKGLDRISASRLPCATIMCTNRLGSLDPAIRRRAAEVLEFGRPDDSQRRLLIAAFFDGTGVADEILGRLVELTGSNSARTYGLTCSDITQRLLPGIALDAYPDGPIDSSRALELAEKFESTPPFLDSNR